MADRAMVPAPSIVHGALPGRRACVQLLRCEWRDPEFRGLCVFATMLLLFS
jgi:hypothetical protein